MKLLIIGRHGQLARTLVDFAPSEHDVLTISSSELDITDREQTVSKIAHTFPDCIINTAAFTAVDAAETDPRRAWKVNCKGAENVAIAVHNIGKRLIHISTDFVFDGTSRLPYQPNAKTNPLNVYGTTKLEGEQRVRAILPSNSIIVRTAWLYSKYRGNFVTTMIRLMKEERDLRVVDDQTGTPTWTGSLAPAIFKFAELEDFSGVYHWTDSGFSNWHQFAIEIQNVAFSLGILRVKTPVSPVSASDYGSTAVRPAYSVLDCSSSKDAIGISPRPWEANLQTTITNGVHL